MMEEALHREYRPAWLGHRRDARRRTALLPGTVWISSAATVDRGATGIAPRVSPDVSVAGRRPGRAETRPIPLLTAIRRIVATIRLWQGRARSRQQLRELSDHMLKDIGLTREQVGYEFPQPFRHCD